MSDKLNVIYSSDDNYAQHMGVSICSLFRVNETFDQIHIYVIDNGISKENRNKLDRLVADYANRCIHFIPFEPWRDKLQLNMQWGISLSSYARLFVASMLPEDIERVLYLDCDMIVCQDLHTLWGCELEGAILGAVQDSVNPRTKTSVGMLENEPYFNAGMLLIDLKKWRNEKVELQCLNFIERKSGSVTHHDQGVLNGVLRGRIFRLPLKNNVMTIHYIYSRTRALKYFHEQAEFYTEREIAEAKIHPTILHFTPSFTCRPWIKGCRHPMKNIYWKTLECSPWRGSKPQKNQIKWYIRLVEWRYRVLPL